MPTTEQSWEKGFDKKFSNIGHGFECDGCCVLENSKDIKDFIRTQRLQAAQEAEAKLKERILEKLKDISYFEKGVTDENFDEYIGRDKALKQFCTLVKSI